MATTVAVFVGTRADLGPLSPVIAALDAAPDIRLRVLTGVMYAAADLASALGFPVVEVDRLAAGGDDAGRRPDEERSWVVGLAEPMTTVDVAAQLAQGALLSASTGGALVGLDADALLVLGDRWELLHVVPPAVLLGLPVVHLHGGEVTEGALDERVRHAVTKLADEHCVASQDAADRLRQLGEPAERVHVTGAPGLDRIAGAAPASDAELCELLGVERVDRPLALFTYHPPTAQPGAPVARWAREAAEAVLAVAGTVVATHPGMDDGRDAILEALADLAAADPRFVLVRALGPDYPRVLAASDVVVGNSSSGVIEAASLHKPAVDIGERQRGRLRGANVVHSDEGRDAVEAAVRAALSPAGVSTAAATTNPYGTGTASPAILDIVRRAGSHGRVKPFVDLARLPSPTEEEE